MFEYLAESRARFLRRFRELGWAEFARDRHASWGSLLGLYLHQLDDEEGWLQFAARGRSTIDAPDRREEAYSTFEQLADDDARVTAQTRALLGAVTAEELGRVVEFGEPSGSTRRTMERIVMHAYVDELAHLGEMIALLWQLEVKPPYLDWIDYGVERPGSPAAGASPAAAGGNG